MGRTVGDAERVGLCVACAVHVRASGSDRVRERVGVSDGTRVRVAFKVADLLGPPVSEMDNVRDAVGVGVWVHVLVHVGCEEERVRVRWTDASGVGSSVAVRLDDPGEAVGVAGWEGLHVRVHVCVGWCVTERVAE